VKLRAATSVRWEGVKRSCALGLPRAAGECEGTERTTARGGGAFCWSRPALRAAAAAREEKAAIEV